MNTEGNSSSAILPFQDSELVDVRTKLFELNAKPDSKTKVFEKKVIIDIDDISNLYGDINHKINSYGNEEVPEITTQVVVDFEKNKSFSFTSWDSFKREHHRESSAILSITLVWDCKIKFKQYKLPQKHKVVVKLINSLSKSEVLNLLLTGNLEESGPISAKIAPVIARVDFVDYLFAEEILNIVEKWNECLHSPNTDKNKVMMWLKKRRRKVSYAIVYGTSFLATLLAVNFLVALINSKNLQFVNDVEISTFSNWLRIFIYIIIGLIIFYKFLDYVGSIIFTQLENYGEYHMFNISKGDEILNDSINEREQKTAFGVIIKVISAVLLNIGASFLFYYIEKLLLI